QRGGIVHPEEISQQLFVGELRRVEFNLNRFRVTGHPGANEVVVWIRDCAARVTHGCLQHAGNLAQDFLHAPEATTSQDGRLTLGSRRSLVGGAGARALLDQASLYERREKS